MNYTATVICRTDTTELYLTDVSNVEENLAFTQFDSNFEPVVLALLYMTDFHIRYMDLSESHIDQDFVFKILPKIKIDRLSIIITKYDKLDITTWINILDSNIRHLEVSFFECFKKKSKDIQFMLDYLTQNNGITIIEVYIDVPKSTKVRDYLDISDCWEIDITQRNTCKLVKKNT